MKSTWLDAFKRQCGIKRALIVHGNIVDIFRDPNNGQSGSITDVLTRVLHQKGYHHVIHWDRHSGCSSKDAAVVDQLKRRTVEKAGGKTCSGDDYDIGTPENDTLTPTAGDSTMVSVDDFFAMILNTMVAPNNHRYAFVVDWSDLLFGQANSLSEAERQWLLLLSKALRNAPEQLDNPSDLAAPPACIIVMVCRSLAGIPPLFYQGNPLVNDIVVPLPNRDERAAFVGSIVSRYNLNPRLCPGELCFESFIDALDAMTLRDLAQLARLSRQVDGPALSADKLVNLYKYGDKSSPWEDLSPKRLRTLTQELGKRVKGQSEAIAKLDDIIIRAFTGLSGLQHSSRQRTPKGTLFFVGPTGVGKTELAKSLARFLFNDDEAFIRFDMSEYNHENSDQRLVGAPPGYVGFEEGGQLTNAVRQRPFSVLLFDEIEKAHGRILDKFLQILEDGRLTDGKGDTVYFSETVIIFTSNIGAHKVSPELAPEQVQQQFIEEVRAFFVTSLQRPELLNRIGNNIVPFNFINSKDVYVQILQAKLAPLRDVLIDKYGFRDVIFENIDAANAIFLNKLDMRNGGRGVLNELQSRLIDPLARYLFSEDDPVNYKGKKLVILPAFDHFEFTTQS